MTEPFLAEIRLMSFQFAPKGWALCNGQLLPINQNQALFALLGTTYGGNGQTTFALPNLQGRVPLHRGNGHTQGEVQGEQTHTLSVAETPGHTHTVTGTSTQATTPVPGNTVTLGTSVGAAAYQVPEGFVAMSNGSISPSGGSQPHPNMQPYLTLSFCIALQGIFPSQN
ncbi:phage tail protein [Humibacillus xanthopallidus]|uniref:Microcystin-dependent protein n=1 Tax=Humibacillus xanthopallidus TaxID=412689 RepID=A0A543H8I6_9MICO|nr:tail fiber protein [Humibacillus xanthopallidus]TQM54610.1 microcystin-dependent protein [Humibacillus xanthopallidus]